MPTKLLNTKMPTVIPVETIERRILLIRGVKVMLDLDIAELYGVSTMRLNEQVKRNHSRFPVDFMFQLNKSEKEGVIAICDNLRRLKFSPHLPYAFTEHGVTMLSSVLNSRQAVAVSVHIVRAFIKIREMLSTHKELAAKMATLEMKQEKQGKQLAQVCNVINRLLDEPIPPKVPIGFPKK